VKKTGGVCRFALTIIPMSKVWIPPPEYVLARRKNRNTMRETAAMFLLGHAVRHCLLGGRQIRLPPSEEILELSRTGNKLKRVRFSTFKEPETNRN
jgi:hypothetical protein